MADIGRAVHTYLQTVGAVTAISGTRGYPGNLPKNPTFPAYVYNLIASSHEHHLTGISGAAIADFQIDVYDDDHITADSLAEQIRLAMVAAGPNTTMGSLTVDKVRHTNTSTTAEAPVDASDGWRHRHRLDFEILHSEATS